MLNTPQLPSRISAKLCFGVLLLLALTPVESAERVTPDLINQYQPIAQRLVQAATSSDLAYHRLAELCDSFGPRLSGSTNLEAAIDWVLAQKKTDGLQNVHGEEVQVPRWVRGEESLTLLEPRHESLPLLGLGGSVATPRDGLKAEVLVVRSFEELKQRAEEARGKIVV